MKSKLFLSIMAAVLLAGSAQAQYTGNNQTNTITGVAIDWTANGAYYVGQFSVYDALVIQNGGVLSNTLGYIGYFFNANNNAVLVTDSGSVWSNTGDLYIGNFGASGNSLTISNVGAVFNGYGNIGSQNGASNNTVLVTDSGSVWSNANDLYVGNNGVLNSLTITNHGTVYNGEGSIGRGNGGNSNSVLVTGSGSVWNNAIDLSVGFYGSGNSLTITNGGAVVSVLGSGVIGEQAGANDNTVLVTGSGSVWSNAHDLVIGKVGAANSLTIAGSGTVYDANGFIGSNANNNAVSVSGSGSVWHNTNDLVVGNVGAENNSLTIANSGRVYNHLGYIGNQSGASNNTVLVTGSGSVWSNANNLHIGYFGVGNSLTIASSGAVYNASGNIGNQPTAKNNAVLVSDPGSVWSNANALSVGLNGAGNSLTITNGAVVTTGGDSVLGGNPSSSNNFVIVSGNGAVWRTLGVLKVGWPGSSNQLVIGTGGSVLANQVIVSLPFGNLTVSNNVVQMNGGSLFVTNAQGSGTLVVSPAGGPGSLRLNSGSVTVNQLVLTNDVNSVLTFNAGTLDSGETLVTTPQAFTVGDGADLAVFHLSGGTHIFLNGPLEIQNNAFLTGCGDIYGNVLIDNGGTVLADCGGTLSFNGSVTNNGSIIATNGTVINFYGPVVNTGQIGPTNNVHFYFAPAIGTTNTWISSASDKWERGFNWSAGAPSIIQPAAYITNASSKTVIMDFVTAILFSNTLTISNLTVSAPSGSTNTLLVNAIGDAPLQIVSNLTVNDGGIVSVTNSALEIDSSGAVPGSKDLFVGVNSAGEQLNILGGRVSDDSARIGLNSSSSNNTVLVSDPGSVWSNGDELVVGYLGVRNLLTIAGSGTVYDRHGYIGYQSGSNSNTVLVTGSGSVWSNSNFLWVGFRGAGNALTITNGAVVAVGGNAILGADQPSSNNLVTVSGNGAAWNISGQLEVGFTGSSNQLIIGTGGSVLADQAVVSLPFDLFSPLPASNNVIQVNGGSLFVTNAQGNGTLVVSPADGPGSLILNSGTVTVNQLMLTNGVNSVFTFHAGLLTSSGTSVSNGQLFVVGDGTDAATFQLNGGVHSFANNLEISNNAVLSGCGTINGNVTIDPGGTVLASCGSPLTFTGIVTNNGTMRAINGSTLETWGPVINNGTIDLINGATNFHGAFINNGTVLDASSVKISQVSKSGQNIVVQIPSVVGHTYQLQFTPSLAPTNWSNIGSSQSGSGGVLTFTDLGGVTNSQRFYREDVTAP